MLRGYEVKVEMHSEGRDWRRSTARHEVRRHEPTVQTQAGVV